MTPSILFATYCILCISSILISCYAEDKLKKFLKRNQEIANETSLNEYKEVVRLNMYFALTQIGLLGTCILIFVGIMITRGKSGFFFGMLFFLAVKFMVNVGELEKKARALSCKHRGLEDRYKEISRVWVKNALPNF
jgi:hypothetical protein